MRDSAIAETVLRRIASEIISLAIADAFYPYHSGSAKKTAYYQRDGVKFLRRAAQDGVESVWFGVVDIDPKRVWLMVHTVRQAAEEALESGEFSEEAEKAVWVRLRDEAFKGTFSDVLFANNPREAEAKARAHVNKIIREVAIKRARDGD